jgi:formate/nitrite transporter
MNDTAARKAPQAVSIDTIMPGEMARRAELSGVQRASMDPLTILVLSLVGGAFVAFGAIFSTTVSAGAGGLPFGVAKLLSGTVFSVGLVMVVVAGAELFTGNNLIVMAWASGKVTTTSLLLNWLLTFVGNCAGAMATAGLMLCTTQYTFGSGAVGLAALTTANSKAALAFVPALALGIMCNALVCLAAWMCYSARTAVDRVALIILPVAAFAAAGFEHSIANAYFIPMGLLIKATAPDSFWLSIGKTAADFPALSWSGFVGNLVPVAIGNIIGGALLVAAVYWFVYLRNPGRGAPTAPTR